MTPSNDSHSTELHFVLLAIATVIVTAITLRPACYGWLITWDRR